MHKLTHHWVEKEGELYWIIRKETYIDHIISFRNLEDAQEFLDKSYPNTREVESLKLRVKQLEEEKFHMSNTIEELNNTIYGS